MRFNPQLNSLQTPDENREFFYRYILIVYICVEYTLDYWLRNVWI